MTETDFLHVTYLSYEGDGEWALRFNGASTRFWEMVQRLRADAACWKQELFAGRGGWLLSEEQLLTYRDCFTNLDEYISRMQGIESEEECILFDVPLSLRAACSLLHLPISVSLHDVRTHYRMLSKLYHPDTGGHHLYFVALQCAYEEIMAFVQAQEQKTA
jgi:hypothetical protein